MEISWNFHGSTMETPWKPQENLMETSLKPHGYVMDFSWIFLGNIMEISWKFHGNLMEILIRAFLTLARPIETSMTLSISIASQSCNFMLVLTMLSNSCKILHPSNSCEDVGVTQVDDER